MPTSEKRKNERKGNKRSNKIITGVKKYIKETPTPKKRKKNNGKKTNNRERSMENNHNT